MSLNVEYGSHLIKAAITEHRNSLFTRDEPRLSAVVIKHLIEKNSGRRDLTVSCTAASPCMVRGYHNQCMLVSNQADTHLASPVTPLIAELCDIIKGYLVDENGRNFYPRANLSSYAVNTWLRPSDMVLIQSEELKPGQGVSADSFKVDVKNNIVDCSNVFSILVEILQCPTRHIEKSTGNKCTRCTRCTEGATMPRFPSLSSKSKSYLVTSVITSYAIGEDRWIQMCRDGNVQQYDGWTFITSSGAAILAEWLASLVKRLAVLRSEYDPVNETLILINLIHHLHLVANANLSILVF